MAVYTLNINCNYITFFCNMKDFEDTNRNLNEKNCSDFMK